MGIGIRLFAVGEDSGVTRLSVRRFERMFLRHDKSAAFPEYAGKSVRLALVALDVENRQPIRVQSADFMLVHFDEHGRVDPERESASMHLVAEMMGGVLAKADPTDSAVIEAAHTFAKKRYDHEFKWKPSEDILARIRSAIWNKRD
ncbi:MAG TPA: hypothetical protein VGS96_20605 [Thermoanaerobaculia bacterium]|nr:hypothetical protein [Thermoanaerobaculia bacterium]